MAKMKSIDDFDFRSKTVLLRVDINSPIDPDTKLIVNENRIQKSLPTIQKLLDKGAMLAIIAHQGDTLDYQNLIPLEEHARKLSGYLGIDVGYIDDVSGPAAQERVKALQPGEAVILGNLRYLSEEISTFENAVKLKPTEMLDTYLVRGLAPIVDYYVNDAFAAAHRNAPSMVAFQELKPTAAGDLLFDEVAALTKGDGRAGTPVRVRVGRRENFRCLRHDETGLGVGDGGQNSDLRRYGRNHVAGQRAIDSATCKGTIPEGSWTATCSSLMQRPIFGTSATESSSRKIWPTP